MPRQEGGMVKLRRLWKGCWKKGGASANFRRWASKLDQVVSSSTAAAASTSASYPLFSIGMTLMVYVVFASMLYDVPNRGFRLSHLLRLDLNGAVEKSLHQDTLKVKELFGKDPLRQDLLVKPSDGGSVSRKDIFDSIWLLHGEIENFASEGGAPGIPGMCIAAEGSSACTPPGALAYWSSAQEYSVKIHSDEDLLASLQAKELSDGRPVVPAELFGGYDKNGIPEAKAVLLSYFLDANASEKKLNIWENAVISARNLHISNINVEVRAPTLQETFKHAVPWAFCSFALCGLVAGVLCSKSLKMWKNAQSRIFLGLFSSVIGALGGIGAVGVCVTSKLEVDGTVLFLVPALCTFITLHSLITLTMIMDDVRLMLPEQPSIDLLIRVATKVVFLPISLPLLSISFTVAICASGVNIPGATYIQMPFPYAIRCWLWAIFSSLISCMLSSFVVVPSLIALDEERQARQRLEILFCRATETVPSEESFQQSHSSLTGYHLFSQKIGNLLLGRKSGKLVCFMGLALCSTVGWFYNTSRLEMDFNTPWPRVAQELQPSSNVASFWSEAEVEGLARGENWARATFVMEDVKFHTTHARESVLKLEQGVISDHRTSVRGVDSWLSLLMKWCEDDANQSNCNEDNWESNEELFYNSLALFLSTSTGKRYATDFVATVDNVGTTTRPRLKAARTHLWHNFISKKSIAAIREVSASAAALNADVFPFLVVQSPEYLWFDAMDSIASAIRWWDILFCAVFGLFCTFFLGTLPSVTIAILGAAVISWGMIMLVILLSEGGFKMAVFDSAAVITILPVTFTSAMSAVIAYAQHPLGNGPISSEGYNKRLGLHPGKKLRSRIGTWGVPAGKMCIIAVVGALPLALSSGRGVILQSILIVVCSMVFGLFIAVLVLWPLLSCLFGRAIIFASTPIDHKHPERWWHYFQGGTSSATRKKNEVAIIGKFSTKGSLSDMFREDMLREDTFGKKDTLPKHVYGGDDDENFDDRSSSSQETNAIPTNIIDRRASIEDDRPLGTLGYDTPISMMSTPPASPPP